MSSGTDPNYLDNSKLSSSGDFYNFLVGDSPVPNRASPAFAVSDAEKRIVEIVKEQSTDIPDALSKEPAKRGPRNLSAAELESLGTYSSQFKRRMKVLPKGTPSATPSKPSATPLNSSDKISDDELAKSVTNEKDSPITASGDQTPLSSPDAQQKEKIDTTPDLRLERAKWSYHFQFKKNSRVSSSLSLEQLSSSGSSSVSTPLADRRNRDGLLANGEIPENALSQIVDVVSGNLSRIAAGGSLLVTGTSLGPVLVTVAATGSLPAIAPGVLGTLIAGGVITGVGLGLHELNRSGSLPESWQRPMERVELVFSIASVGLLAVGGLALGIPVISAADLVGSANNTLTISAAASDVRAALSNIDVRGVLSSIRDHDSELSS